jgi:hypothetical protein
LQSNVNGKKVSLNDFLHCLLIDTSIVLAVIHHVANRYAYHIVIQPCCSVLQQTAYERIEDVDGFAAYRVQLTAPIAGDIKVLTYALYTDVLMPYPEAITQMQQQYMVSFDYLANFICATCTASRPFDSLDRPGLCAWMFKAVLYHAYLMSLVMLLQCLTSALLLLLAYIM